MLPALHSLHFVGIAGTAMASAAVAMQEKGFRVTGSDQNVYPPMSTFLASRGIDVKTGYAEANLADQPDLVVIGNAISRGNPEAEAVLERKWRYCSLPELLREFFIRGRRTIVVAGTHGKTTTTSLLAWVFEHNGLNPSFLIGGMPNNLGQGARFTDSEWFIIEGDEYDTAFFDKRSKFIHYLPEVALINNLEFDHADIFPNLAAIQTTFRHFINLIPRNGLLLANGDDPNLAPLLDITHCPVKRFGLGKANDLRAVELKLDAGHSAFRLVDTALSIRLFPFRVQLVGEHNVRNALAVAACARHCGLTESQIQSAFETFTGIKRRMEIRGTCGGVTVVDDFGHHPSALRETLKALRLRFPGQRLWAIFEPRSNTTRRGVFQFELADALSQADVIVIAEVARWDQLAPDERLDPARLMRDLQAAGKPTAYLPTVDAIVQHALKTAKHGDVLCVFSNGGFGGIHQKLLDGLAQRFS
ncbi:MAG: UDP-N-acetylmuramate:L-alanyl-gamma-D-glutamyl-meso-diaminopimelate ligase [Candidatus Omnitrophica bacterium]|nr:UDP-N-acetylmuramate:L-alanyl-gamma-D-glutamyl-meso-diaminopimelate ligase [Candidatus Omnitrophota bacterium]